MGDYKREFCKSGKHRMEEPNLIIHSQTGFRQCRACTLERNKRWRRQRRQKRHG